MDMVAGGRNEGGVPRDTRADELAELWCMTWRGRLRNL